MNSIKSSNTPMKPNNTNKHPKVSEMVLIAVAMLNDRNGSSVKAIKKYISSSFKLDEKKLSAYVKRYLLMAVASGTLIQTKGKGATGSFRLGGSMKLKMSELLNKVIIPNENKRKSSSSMRESPPVKAATKSKKMKSNPSASGRAV